MLALDEAFACASVCMAKSLMHLLMPVVAAQSFGLPGVVSDSCMEVFCVRGPALKKKSVPVV